MKLPKNVVHIINILNENNYEAFIVGGCVRDMLMGKEPTDWDITTSAKPESVKRLFKRVVETGVEHGTVTVVIGKENYEVTTYRIDGNYSDSRRPEEVFFTANLLEDLVRRDFTVNAIAYHPDAGFADPYEGREDIALKIIKGVGNADERFKEDALRMLRAVRFSSQLGFVIEEKTFLALKDNSRLIKNISVERICAELIKTFTGTYVENAAYFLKCDLIGLALPLAANYFDKYLNEAIRLISKLDVSKRTPQSVLTLLFFHMKEDLFTENLRYLKLDNKTVKNAKILKKELENKDIPTPYNIKNTISQIGGELFFESLELKNSMGEDITTLYGIGKRAIECNEPIFLKDLALDGNDVKLACNVQGKDVGIILSGLHKAVLESPAMNNARCLKKLALKMAKDII